MSQPILGTYYFPKSSKAHEAQLQVSGDMISLHYLGTCAEVFDINALKVSTEIPGVPMSIEFPDGAKFTAKESAIRLQPHRSNLAAMEKSKQLIVASVILVPLLLWFMIMVVMPRMAQASVAYLPEAIPEQMGKQAFKLIEELFLEPSTIEESTQQQVKQQWQQALSALNLSSDKYVLHVYASESLGPNAFALPDGTVVITDELLEKLIDKPDAVLAVLLHEIGHVEHRHSLRMVAQSVSNAVVFAMIFGDLESIGEILLGSGSTLVQSQFSRDMEREADEYALSHLVLLGKSTEAFAQAMQSFLDLSTGDKDPKLLKYLSSHPDTQERIDKARNYQQ